MIRPLLWRMGIFLLPSSVSICFCVAYTDGCLGVEVFGYMTTAWSFDGIFQSCTRPCHCLGWVMVLTFQHSVFILCKFSSWGYRSVSWGICIPVITEDTSSGACFEIVLFRDIPIQILHSFSSDLRLTFVCCEMCPLYVLSTNPMSYTY